MVLKTTATTLIYTIGTLWPAPDRVQIGLKLTLPEGSDYIDTKDRAHYAETGLKTPNTF